MSQSEGQNHLEKSGMETLNMCVVRPRSDRSLPWVAAIDPMFWPQIFPYTRFSPMSCPHHNTSIEILHVCPIDGQAVFMDKPLNSSTPCCRRNQSRQVAACAHAHDAQYSCKESDEAGKRSVALVLSGSSRGKQRRKFSKGRSPTNRALIPEPERAQRCWT